MRLDVVAAAVSTLAAAPLAAQSLGTLRGVVYDSIVGAPLAGAEVWLQDNPRAATTGADGAFRIDSLAPGAYTVTFAHPSLDSLGIGAPYGTVAVRAGEATDVRLTTPSVAGIAARLCPATPLDSAGVVLGVVRDAAAGAPLRGAAVSARWAEWAVRGAAVTRSDRRVDATTDAAGRYVACGVPNDVVLSLRAAADGARATGEVLLDVRGRTLTWRNLVIGSPAAASSSGGVVALTVLDAGGRPVAGASARPDGVADFRPASDDGKLRLADLPTGSRSIEVRAIGYERATVAVDLVAGREVEQTVRLARNVVPLLDTVRIVGARPYRDVSGFEERRRQGAGHYMTNAEIERRVASRFTDLVRRFPGVHVEVPRGPGPLTVVSSRASRGAFGQNGVRSTCPLAVFVDDIPLAGADLDAAINPAYVRGIEFYPGSAGVPPKYGGSPCGTILVWTR